MLIAVTCPTCEYRFKVHARFAGRQGRCPNPECRSIYRVPFETPTSPGTPELVAQRPQPRAERVERNEVRIVPEVVQPTATAVLDAPRPQPVRTPTRPSAAVANPRSVRTPRRERRTRTTSVRPTPESVSPVPTKTAKGLSWGRRGVVALGAALGLAGVAWLGLLFLGADDEQPKPERAPDVAAKVAEREGRLDTQFGTHVKPFLANYCNDCHGDADGEAGLDFTTYNGLESVRADRRKWDDVVSMLQIGAMPPADHDSQPKPAERDAVLAWLGEALGVDCTIEHDPGRVTIRRLNRTEYENTIRDLVGVDVDPAKDFPSDDVGEGFDNIADVLTLPPLLLEKYVSAAEAIVEAAIDEEAYAPFEAVVDGDDLRGGGGGPDGFRTLSSTGEVGGDVRFPSQGRYTIRVEAQADQAGDEPAKFELRVNGKVVKTFETEGYRKPKFYETTTTVTSGRARVDARFVNDFYDPDAENRRDQDRNLHVGRIEVRSEEGGGDPDLWRSHREIIVARPGDAGNLSVREAALRVLRPFTRRAFRRPVDDEEIEKYVGLVEMVVENGDPYERGIQVALTGVLVSPHFLFRIERDRDPDDPAATRDLDDYELATRLSYFLWSSMPDEELFRLAEQRRLHEPKVLEAQVRRMLRDGRSRELVENFGGQWLNLGQLDGLIPDPTKFPDFSDDLREDMQRETLEFLEWVVRRDRSVLDLLDARTTFVNERLAKHYGIEGVRGTAFRMVSLDGLPRAGVLTQGSILLLTSNPDRTSPVKRGKWIMENLLGTPPPEPPPNVPTLEEAAKSNPGATLREQLEVHRRNPVCRSCHEQMDALGFGFENFDAVGRYRTKEDGHAVDSTGTLPSGEKFDGPIELIAVLKRQRAKFAANLSRKMLTYALGRGLEYYDECAIEEIAKNLADDGHRFSRLVLEVVRSEPFLKRRGDGDRQ